MDIEKIKKEIINKLNETEREHDVKIVFAIESGSRGWGFESPDSDFDCRFVYTRRKDSYLTVLEKKDFIEYDVDSIFDVNGWDLEKFIKHIMKSNSTLHEWLSSNVIYIKNDECTKLLQDLALDFFNPISACYHYMSMAKKKFNVVLSDDCKIKTYFYVLRPLANVRYICEHKQIPPMEYFKTLEMINVSSKVKEEINKLYDLKITVEEKYKAEANKVLIDYFESEIEYLETEMKNIKFTKFEDKEKCDIIFREILDRMWDCEGNNK